MWRYESVTGKSLHCPHGYAEGDLPAGVHFPLNQPNPGLLVFIFRIRSLGCPNRVPQTRWLKTAETRRLAVLETGSPTSRCRRDRAPCETCSGTLPCLSLASGGGLPAVLGASWLEAAALPSLPLSQAVSLCLLRFL